MLLCYPPYQQVHAYCFGLSDRPFSVALFVRATSTFLLHTNKAYTRTVWKLNVNCHGDPFFCNPLKSWRDGLVKTLQSHKSVERRRSWDLWLRCPDHMIVSSFCGLPRPAQIVRTTSITWIVKMASDNVSGDVSQGQLWWEKKRINCSRFTIYLHWTQ